MRSTLDIIIAVKESRPTTEKELRLALLVMCSIEHFVREDLEALIDCVENNRPSTNLRAEFAKGTLERMFKARKEDPSKWLGPKNTPGTPEYEAFYAWGKALLNKAEEKLKEKP